MQFTSDAAATRLQFAYREHAVSVSLERHSRSFRHLVGGAHGQVGMADMPPFSLAATLCRTVRLGGTLVLAHSRFTRGGARTGGWLSALSIFPERTSLCQQTCPRRCAEPTL